MGGIVHERRSTRPLDGLLGVFGVFTEHLEVTSHKH